MQTTTKLNSVAAAASFQEIMKYLKRSCSQVFSFKRLKWGGKNYMTVSQQVLFFYKYDH